MDEKVKEEGNNRDEKTCAKDEERVHGDLDSAQYADDLSVGKKVGEQEHQYPSDEESEGVEFDQKDKGGENAP